ncbi:MAG TPA: hypothetical protein PKA64_09565 [Myxococcota bacterium]|nr:hypothetical protein [Myxococcota bacterium]
MGLLLDALHRISAAAVTRGAADVIVRPSASSPDLDPDQAVRLASLPLFVLVENAISDAAFLDRATPAPWRDRLRGWLREGAVVFEHAGGVDEIPRMIDRHGAAEAPSAFGLGPDAWRARHIVLIDRDTSADGGLGRGARRVVRACAEREMADRLHVLQRPTIECYLPVPALRAIADACDPDSRARLEPAIAARAAGADYEPIRRERAFKNAFLDDALPWHAGWFRADGSADELIEIVEKIAALT